MDYGPALQRAAQDNLDPALQNMALMTGLFSNVVMPMIQLGVQKQQFAANLEIQREQMGIQREQIGMEKERILSAERMEATRFQNNTILQINANAMETARMDSQLANNLAMQTAQISGNLAVEETRNANAIARLGEQNRLAVELQKQADAAADSRLRVQAEYQAREFAFRAEQEQRTADRATEQMKLQTATDLLKTDHAVATEAYWAAAQTDNWQMMEKAQAKLDSTAQIINANLPAGMQAPSIKTTMAERYVTELPPATQAAWLASPAKTIDTLQGLQALPKGKFGAAQSRAQSTVMQAAVRNPVDWLSTIAVPRARKDPNTGGFILDSALAVKGEWPKGSTIANLILLADADAVELGKVEEQALNSPRAKKDPKLQYEIRSTFKALRDPGTSLTDLERDFMAEGLELAPDTPPTSAERRRIPAGPPASTALPDSVANDAVAESRIIKPQIIRDEILTSQSKGWDVTQRLRWPFYQVRTGGRMVTDPGAPSRSMLVGASSAWERMTDAEKEEFFGMGPRAQLTNP